MAVINCCICGNASLYHKLFDIDGQELVRCGVCNLLYFKNFKKVDYDKFDMNYYVKNLSLFHYYQNIIADIILRYKQKGSLFDIGGGIGILMGIMKRKGWDVNGIEASGSGVHNAKRISGVNMSYGDFLKYKIKKKCDVVTANHVIEHVDNPNLFLKKMGHMLKNDGIILLGLPNAGSIEFKILRKRWVSLVPSMHIWQFSPSTIKRLLENNNFKVIDIIIEQPRREFSTLPKKIIGHAIHEPFRFLMNLFRTGYNMFVIGVKNGNK